MSKSILTISKEMEKKAYDATPLGQVEKKLRGFYSSGKKLSEEVSKQVYQIRDDNEKVVMALNDKSTAEIKEIHRKYRVLIDEALLGAMSKEWEIIEQLK